MVRLHLIGFTTDLKNLIFGTRRTAKRGGYILEINKRLLGALEEVAKLEAEGSETVEKEAPSSNAKVVPAAIRPSALSPKEIQTLLREGKSEEQVARLAQTDISWIRRFTGPIIAERAGVIDSVRAGLIAKPRLGPSAVSVGQAIQQNLSEKRVQMDPESFERAWKASRRGGRWLVVFQYSSRGKKRLARFSYDPESREVTATNDVALEVGWRPGTLKRGRRTNGSQSGRKKENPAGKRAVRVKQTTARKSAPSSNSRRADSSTGARSPQSGRGRARLSQGSGGR